MKKQHEITAILEQVQASAGNDLIIEKEAVLAEYEKVNASRTGITIKVLTILGGILATLALVGFLLLSGLYKSEIKLTITGVLFVAGAIFRIKTNHMLISDTISVTAFVTGLFLLSFGLTGFMNDSMICITLIIIGIITLVIVQNYLLAFLSVLTIHGAAMALIVENKFYKGLHFYTVAVLITFTLFVLQEARMITKSKKISSLYNPIRLGLLCSVLAGFVLIDFSDIFRFPIYLNLLPSIAAILIMLLSFRVNYKIGFVLGILALIYFITRYYYNLQITLLTKSILLLASGVLFILFYLLTQKKLDQHEKV